jgi:hypothetical protein
MAGTVPDCTEGLLSHSEGLVEIQPLAEGLARKGEVKLDLRSPEYAEIHSKFVKVSELVDFGPGYSRRGGMELKRDSYYYYDVPELCQFGIGAIFSWMAWATWVSSIVPAGIVVHSERVPFQAGATFGQMSAPEIYSSVPVQGIPKDWQQSSHTLEGL